MKNATCLIFAAFFILRMLQAPIPATAQAEHIPITGTCYLIAAGGFTESFPNDPDYRIWDTMRTSHWRYQLWYITCDYNDDRLDGNLVSVDSWNVNWKVEGPFGKNFAYSYSADPNWQRNDLWEGHSEGTNDFDTGIQTVKGNWKGLGIYQSLLAKTNWTSTEEWGVYHVEGELIVPNGK
jgi:hypothetical protein